MNDPRAPLRPGVDRERCVGASMCALTAPAVFDQDEDEGLMVLLHPAPAPEHRPAARMAVGLCPAHGRAGSDRPRV
ncbi:ferredoxin [Streptomyces uncialis]|uniref:ferredoxin n=1 Tax=Streptomyces uncialis TaxID=1048205 RepID=UPI0037FEB834